MTHPWGRSDALVAALAVAVALALAGCGGLRLPGEPPAGAIPPVAGEGQQQGPADYPSLATVPARPPQLGYRLEQKRAVENELVADRERAAYLEALVDYETGRSATPPPAPPPPEPPAARERAIPPLPPAPKAGREERARGPGDDPAVEAYVKEALERDQDEGELKDFLRRLERPGPGAARPAPAASDPDPPARPQGSELRRFGSHLGGVLGVDTAAAAGSSGVLATVPFGPGSAALPTAAEAGLSRALERARTVGAGLRVAGGGDGGPVPVGRVRAVAQALLRLGASPDMLALAPGGGAGEEVRVSLDPRPRG